MTDYIKQKVDLKNSIALHGVHRREQGAAERVGQVDRATDHKQQADKLQRDIEQRLDALYQMLGQ